MNLTVEQVVERLGIVSARTVRRKAAAGDFPGAKKFGRKWAIPATSVRQYAEHGERGRPKGEA